MSTTNRKIYTDIFYREAITKLRTVFDGYVPLNGYDLRKKDLTKSLSVYRKRKIREQLEYLAHWESGIPKRIYRARTKKAVDLILKSQGAKYVPMNMRVAFIPIISKDKTEIKYRKSRKITSFDKVLKRKVNLVEVAPIETVTMGVTRRYIHINPDFLLDNTLDAVQTAMKLEPANFYTIQAGGDHEIYNDEYKIKQDDTAEIISKKIKKLQLKYNNEESNHFWENWLGGLIAYKYPTQSTWDEYNARKHRVRFENRLERVKKRNRLRYRTDRIIELNAQLKSLYKLKVKYIKNKSMLESLDIEIESRVKGIIKLKAKVLKDK